MKKIKLTLHGGFHNADAVNVHISARDYECLRDHVATLADVLSDSQLARMNRHFCGVEGCTCGGVSSVHRGLKLIDHGKARNLLRSLRPLQRGRD